MYNVHVMSRKIRIFKDGAPKNVGVCGISLPKILFKYSFWHLKKCIIIFLGFKNSLNGFVFYKMNPTIQSFYNDDNKI